MRGQLHALGRHRHDGRAEARQRIDEGVDRARALEVAGDRDLQVLEALVLLLEGEQVAQRLGRMLVAAVAAIDHRDRRVFGGEPRRAVARMADHDDVGVVGDHAHRVGEAFALGGRTGRRIGAGDDLAAEPDHRALERQPRAGRGLVEQAREDVVRADVGAAADAIGEMLVGQLLQVGLGGVENGLDVLVGQVVDRNDVARGGKRFGGHLGCHRPSLLVASGHPQRQAITPPAGSPAARASDCHAAVH